MTKRLLPLLVAAALALSGCLGLFGDDDLGETDPLDDNDDTGDGTNGDDETPADEDENGDDNGAENQSPTASISANTTSGDAPLNVTFTLEGSDPDGDALTWSLDLGDGSSAQTGDTLPATVEHSFTAAGNHTAVLTVSDGELSASDEVTITVAEPASIANPVQTGSAGDCLDYNILYELDGFDSPLAPTVDTAGGTGFSLTADDGTPFIDFYDAEGSHVGYNGDGAGTVPADASYGIICIGALGQYPDVPLLTAEWAYQDGF